MARRETIRFLFPHPEEIVYDLRGHNEEILLSDQPSLRAFLADSIWEVLAVLGLVALFVWSLAQGASSSTAFLLFILIDILVLWLVVRRFRLWYTRYVITNLRVMKVSGVFTRSVVSIPWIKVTDLSYRQGLVGKWLGFATVRIESANEESGLKDLKDLRDPIAFNRLLTDMIISRQGLYEPPWAEAGPLEALPAGWWARRRIERRRRMDQDAVSE